MKKLRKLWVHAGQPAILYMIGFALIGSMLFFRLGTLVRPFTPAELTARASSATSQQIIDNPVNAPHKLGQHILQKTGRKGPLAMRSISALFGLAAVILFFLVAKVWFTSRIAFIGTVLFTSSSYFLHTARAATPDIMLMALLALVACGSWLRYSKVRPTALLITTAVTMISLYVPGMIWYVVGFLLLQRKVLSRELRHTPAPVIVLAFFLCLLLISPLVLGITGNPSLIKLLVGLPLDLPDWSEIGRNLAAIPVQLFVRGPDNPAVWLGRLPILDIFSSIMFILGSYRLVFQRKLDRTRLIFSIMVSGSLLVALGGLVSVVLLLPFIYIIVTYGAWHYLQQWYSVFPRNPFARSSGLLLLGGAFALCVLYNGSRYFIAWPNTPVTRQVHSQNP